MKKNLFFFLVVMLAGYFNVMPVYADAIPYLPVKAELEGTVADLSTFELPAGDFSLDVQCTDKAKISICGIYDYTATAEGNVRFARKAGTVIVYEGNAYKTTLFSTLEPIPGIENALSATLLDGEAYGPQITLGEDDYWDMTLYVVNPDFEDGTIVNKAPIGWIQTTNAGTSKISVVEKGDGSVIMGGENHWQIYSGGAVTGKAYQIISNLPSGKYKFTAGLYASITGPVYLYANNGKTEVVNDFSAYYEVEGIVVDGTLEIGMDIATTGGTTLEFDHVTLAYYGPDIESIIAALGDLIDVAKEKNALHMNATVKAELSTMIAAAEDVLQSPTEESIGQIFPELKAASNAAQLSIAEYITFKAAIDTAEIHAVNYLAFPGYSEFSQVIDDTKSAYSTARIEGESITTLIAALQTAEVACRLTQEAPYDATFTIVNPSFEDADSYKGWVNNGMQTQSNASFELKVGNRYLEKWVAEGNNLPDVDMTQTIHDLPNGAYELTIVAFCAQGGIGATGGYLFANKGKTELGEAGEYKVEAVVMSNTLTFGIKTENSTGNWIAADDFKLQFIGYNLSVAVATLQEIISEAEQLQYSEEPISQRILEELGNAINRANEACDAPTEEGIKAASLVLVAALDNAETSVKQYATLLDELIKLGELYEEGEALYPDGHADFVKTYEEIADEFNLGSYDAESITQAIEQLKAAELACYLSATPPMDATFVMKNPSFEDGGANWTIVSGRISTSSSFCKDGEKAGNTWNSTYTDTDFYQEVSLPAGRYTLTAVMRVGLVTNQYIYIEIGNQRIKSEPVQFAGDWSAATGDLSAWNDMTLSFSLYSSRTVRVGAACEIGDLSGDGYFQIDDFRLTFTDKVTSVEMVSNADNSLSVVGCKGGVSVTSVADTLVRIYSIHGQMIKSQNIGAGETFLTLPQGFYLIEGTKVFVH